MAARLDRLGGGHYCLNFDVGDAPEIRATILELYGPPQPLSDHVVAATICIGNAELTYYFEWDEPCLISRSPVGDAVLEAIAQHLDRAV